MLRGYLDTNVFVSLIKNEIDNKFRLLFREAEDFFLHCKGNFILVLSDLFFYEVEQVTHYYKSEVLEYLKNFEIQVEIVDCGIKESEKAKEFLKLGMHKLDAIHAANAFLSKCDFIATFNVQDFKAVEGLISAKTPSELIE